MMKNRVHILATVRNPALLDATRLVFKTLRVGFPTAEVIVHGNGLDWAPAQEIKALAVSYGGQYLSCHYTSHDAWIEGLLLRSSEPFWILDTDVVFFGCVENWYHQDTWTDFAGRFEPGFDEEWTQSRHVARLHTALMYFNPQLLRPKMREWMGRIPAPWGLTAQINLVRQHFVPVRSGAMLFYDSCAGLYQAGFGTPFTEEQDQTFEHLHAATYVDLIGPHLSLPDLAGAHRRVYANPQAARGLQAQQNRYYKARDQRPDRLKPELQTTELVVGKNGAHVERSGKGKEQRAV